MPHLKIVTEGLHGKNTRIFGVRKDENGEEIVEDLTPILMTYAIEVKLNINSLNKAVLHCYVHNVEIDTTLDSIEREYIGG